METVNTIEAETARYLTHKRFQMPQWAVNDCNTFIVEYHDYIYGTQHFDNCGFNYSSKLSAARWQQNFISAPEFLKMIGYKQTMLTETGDVLLQDLGPFWCAWLVYQRRAYTVSHEHGLVCVSVNNLEDYTVWSNQCVN